jgi:hypothetical protein
VVGAFEGEEICGRLGLLNCGCGHGEISGACCTLQDIPVRERLARRWCFLCSFSGVPPPPVFGGKSFIFNYLDGIVFRKLVIPNGLRVNSSF